MLYVMEINAAIACYQKWQVHPVGWQVLLCPLSLPTFPALEMLSRPGLHPPVSRTRMFPPCPPSPTPPSPNCSPSRTRADHPVTDPGAREERQGEAKPFVTLLFCPSFPQKATDSGKKPEEEEENQMAGRPGHRHPQTAVRDIVMAQGPGHSDRELASPRDPSTA